MSLPSPIHEQCPKDLKEIKTGHFIRHCYSSSGRVLLVMSVEELPWAYVHAVEEQPPKNWLLCLNCAHIVNNIILQHKENCDRRYQLPSQHLIKKMRFLEPKHSMLWVTNNKGAS